MCGLLLNQTAHENLSRKNQQHDILQRIPTEIACLVFEHWSSLQTSAHNLPFQLGSVCTFWRNIAWATPTLWREVTFNLDRVNLLSRIALLEEIIPRSQALPLHLRIQEASPLGRRLPPPNGFSTSKDCTSLFDTILQCSDRWYKLDLDISPFYVRRLLDAGLNIGRGCKAPRLHAIRFQSLTTSNGMSAIPSNINFSTLAPQLEKFELMEYCDVDSLERSLSWEKLVELTVNSTSAACLQAVRRAPSLRHLKLLGSPMEEWRQGDAIPVARMDAELDEPFIHPELRKLNVYVGVPQLRRVTTFFGHLTCPNLEELTLSNGQSQTIQPLVSFFSRSQCVLTCLKMHDFLCSNNDLSTLLTQLPFLIQLDLITDRSVSRTKEYCDVLFQSSNQENQEAKHGVTNRNVWRPARTSKRSRFILPKLEILHISSGWSIKDGFTFLNQVLDYVEDDQTPLNTFNLSLFLSDIGKRDIPEDLRQRVRKCKARGRTLSVRSNLV